MTTKTKPKTKATRRRLVRTTPATPRATTPPSLASTVIELLRPVLSDPAMREVLAAGRVPSTLPGPSTPSTNAPKALGADNTSPTLLQVLELTTVLRKRLSDVAIQQADLVQRLTGQYPLEPVNGVRSNANDGMTGTLEGLVHELHDLTQQLETITAALSRQL